ncbi:hypothetical protein [Nocardia barduliensis]|uniref:hypothetical protein n=1 Tax=Nocardia barduliensis TaxID=2736643 RepID=UPI001571992A|nr:hypothetical protein [Nocardia barduliensis]
MDDEYPEYELLAKHLAPKFGNIYEYNLRDPDGIASYDGQDWTPALREAIKDYLMRHCPPGVFARIYDVDGNHLGDARDKAAAVDRLLENSQPWEIALDVYNSAVSVVSTLHELIGHLKAWPSEMERTDAETWLEAHEGGVAWEALAKAAEHHELLPIAAPPATARPLLAQDLVRALTPIELVLAWEHVVGPAHTDFTDDEWQLLAPHFPQRRVAGRYHGGHRPLSEWELAKKRRTLNGLRFKRTSYVVSFL